MAREDLLIRSFEAVPDTLMKFLDIRAEVVQFSEQALSSGTKASEIDCVRPAPSGQERSFGRHGGTDTTEAVLQAIIQETFILAFPSEGV